MTTVMKLLVCKDCGKAYEGESRSAACPRCAEIDKALPVARHDTPVVGIPHVVREQRARAVAYEPPVDQPPPPVVIPGPASPLTNTLNESRPPVDDFGMAELGRFSAPPAAQLVHVPDTTACPRCAETIKIAAKMCRFCNLDLARPAETQSFKRSTGSRGRVEVEHEPRRGRREVGYGQCRCGAWTDEVVPGWAIAMAILFFPLGLLFLIVKEKRCPRCSPKPAPAGYVAAIVMALFAFVLLVVWAMTR